ncbi:hypothetical protein VTK73DRAFT_4257 [Phialemonium thermophilum]|uniref:Uncharacterized protein n=1 Tax=Phialemonium thermophilum TaxID=223376 RepID=A0ABR3VAR1_9PEZI
MNYDDSSRDGDFATVGRTYGASWVKIVSSWVCYAMFLWTLVAPAVLPDRWPGLALFAVAKKRENIFIFHIRVVPSGIYVDGLFGSDGAMEVPFRLDREDRFFWTSSSVLFCSQLPMQVVVSVGAVFTSVV